MSKSQKIRDLLLENRTILLNGESTNGICYDGIVHEASFERQPIKVAVLLKETNGNDENGQHQAVLSDWDYLRWLKEQQVEGKPLPGETKDPFYSSTFRKLCLWLTEFFDTAYMGECNPNQYFLPDGSVDISKVRTSLGNVALVNLKKSWGTEQTDPPEVIQLRNNPCYFFNFEKGT